MGRLGRAGRLVVGGSPVLAVIFEGGAGNVVPACLDVDVDSAGRAVAKMRIYERDLIGARASGKVIVGVDVGMIGAVRVTDVQAPFLDRVSPTILHADKI